MPVTRTCKAWLAGSPVPRGFFDPQSDVQPVNLLDDLMNGSIVAAPAWPVPSGMATMTAAGIDPVALSTALATPPHGPSTVAPADYYPVGDQHPKLSDPPGKSDNAGRDWGPFGRAAKDLAAALALHPRAATPKCPVSTGAMNSEITKALDPNTTMAAAYAGRLQFAPAGTWHGTDPLGPVYLAPTFPMPAFEPLRKISQDWIIPGLDQCPPNTIAVLEANQGFIEAYMVGLNFELGRELLWQKNVNKCLRFYSG